MSARGTLLTLPGDLVYVSGYDLSGNTLDYPFAYSSLEMIGKQRPDVFASQGTLGTVIGRTLIVDLLNRGRGGITLAAVPVLLAHGQVIWASETFFERVHRCDHHPVQTPGDP